MGSYSVAVIGTGPHPGTGSHDGYSMGYRHATGYRAAEGCEIEACADIVPENAEAFVGEQGLDADRAYTDHRRMLDEVEPDIVSVCTPPSTHYDLVADCADHDAVRAIHCEKPMAITFGESRAIVEVCADRDVRLTINLQNRCSGGVREVKRLVQGGAIGDLQRIEVARHDLLQTGIHHIDLANHLTDDSPIEWVLGQVDYPEEHLWYTGMHAETQSLGTWKYDTGVYGLCSTGAGMDAVGRSTNQVIGTDGRVEMDLAHHEFSYRTPDSDGWQPIEVDDRSPQVNAICEVVAALDRGGESPLRGENALAATEVVYAIWESARRRGRVDLPLDIDDNPLQDLVESGRLPPRG